MMWRSHKDESYFDISDQIAWDYVLPYKHIPILEEDQRRTKELSEYLRPIIVRLKAEWQAEALESTVEKHLGWARLDARTISAKETRRALLNEAELLRRQAEGE